jgi:hypothetical protein
VHPGRRGAERAVVRRAADSKEPGGQTEGRAHCQHARGEQVERCDQRPQEPHEQQQFNDHDGDRDAAEVARRGVHQGESERGVPGVGSLGTGQPGGGEQVGHAVADVAQPVERLGAERIVLECHEEAHGAAAGRGEEA